MKERQKQNVPQKLMEQKNDIFRIKPSHIKIKEYTVFDATRDNKGKSLKANDLINILDTI